MELYKNRNIYAGSCEYASDFALEFKDPSTLTRYIDRRFRRLQFHLKSFFVIALMSWIALLFISKEAIISYRSLIVLVSIFLSGYFSLVKKYRVISRVILIIGEFYFQRVLLENIESVGTVGYLLLFNIPTFIINWLLIYIWTYHLEISLIFKLMLTSQSFYWEIFIIILTTIGFAFMERLDKENWVLYDTFKKSQNTYHKIIDKFPTLTFIVDPLGRVLYHNKAGKVAYERSKALKMNKQPKGIFEMIHPDYHKQLSEILRKNNEKVESINVPLLVNDPMDYLEAKNDTNFDIDLISKGKIIK